MIIPACPRCGGTFGDLDEDGELHCGLCGERQGPPLLPARLVSSRRLDPPRLLGAEGPP